METVQFKYQDKLKQKLLRKQTVPFIARYRKEAWTLK